MGPKERHLKRYQNGDGEKNAVVEKILKFGSLSHEEGQRRKKKKRVSGKSRTINQGGSPTTGR